MKALIVDDSDLCVKTWHGGTVRSTVQIKFGIRSRAWDWIVGIRILREYYMCVRAPYCTLFVGRGTDGVEVEDD